MKTLMRAFVILVFGINVFAALEPGSTNDLSNFTSFQSEQGLASYLNQVTGKYSLATINGRVAVNNVGQYLFIPRQTDSNTAIVDQITIARGDLAALLAKQFKDGPEEVEISIKSLPNSDKIEVKFGKSEVMARGADSPLP